jgi:hypothetical protein
MVFFTQCYFLALSQKNEDKETKLVYTEILFHATEKETGTGKIYRLFVRRKKGRTGSCPIKKDAREKHPF